ncbi:bacterial regulatory s, gntR family protein [Bordetella holmesii 30539]|uniref:FCD domain protein n=3 Tax=Bordetella holmesii TaxID=35814 RepID=A0A158M8D9_9BORD|nr:bacterial regulatory s, gntR family protein [Bordetella holmesii 30539]EXX96314.1 bacterial regulatory s, gntR family protein [Bordetella holmesii 1058]KAK80802.1 FCD domain protein [Bordetella holmesii CDC-H572-BH]KAK84601.1 FCD domain protein [Bordetella holmesii CDC-H809-BH]KAK87948.1 FCD domain protein [Bordetella holmesii H620]KAK89244.1 FCD domain protein [Bordetella holmesii CDC-H635-BH]KAK96151.1 FCD domain protein [Bordetella holmesii CDC-H585-BH]KCV03447.1 FCD domain protein [Bo
MQHFFMSSDFRTPVKAPATIPYFLQEQIRELIIDGTFAPGEPLREQDLEQRFGTSRSPIREALRLLELTGMVAHVQRRGVRVRRYTKIEIQQLCALRAELAGYSIRQLDGLISAELLQQLRACDGEMARMHAAQDLRRYADALRQFYLIAVRHTGNKPLEDVLARLYEQVEPMRYIVLRHALAKLAYDAFHRDVLLALEGGAPDQAAEAARRHIMDHLPEMVQCYEAVADPA